VPQKAQVMSVKPQQVSLEDIYFKLQADVREGVA